MIVYDPVSPSAGMNAGGWSGMVCNQWDHFCRVFWASRGCLVVIDEALDAFREDPAQARPMLTRGRHVDPRTGGGGHTVAIVSQRHRGLDKTARDQVSTLYAFTVNSKDAEDLADDWNCPALMQLPSLPPLHYVYLQRHGTPRRGVLAFKK